MRSAVLLALACLATAAEVVRRDVQFSLGSAPTDFDYTISSPGGTFSGSDAFESAVQTRLGGRWAVTAPGWSIAPVVGGDLLYRSASYSSGGGLEAMGLAVTAGGAWAITDHWSADLELALSFEQADLTLDGGSELSGSGTLIGTNLRLRGVYLLNRSWSAGLELGREAASGTISADRERDVDLDIAGWTASLLLIWRLSMRPADLE